MISVCYRGPLDSCNYGCWYCPFSKNKITADNVAEDQRSLDRFIEWVSRRSHALDLLFTPWGEAAIYDHYQSALAKLSYMNHVRVCGIQTNLSCGLGWLEKCDLAKLRLWIAWHPDQTSETRFINKLLSLVSMGVKFNVGVVALHENIKYAEKLRNILPDTVYVWLNAAKDQGVVYEPELLSRISLVDPIFSVNVENFKTFDEDCRAGVNHVLVDGSGNVSRCHFIKKILEIFICRSFLRFCIPEKRLALIQCATAIWGNRFMRAVSLRATLVL
jgi:hypothetical protein